MKKLDAKGSHVVAVVMAFVVFAAIGFVGWRVLNNDKKKDDVKSVNDGSGQRANQQTNSNANVTWMWGGEKWQASGTPPSCDDPLKIDSPADISKATAVLYPGQVRGNNYKPHGGFIFRNSNNSDITVKAPIDGQLVEGSRYIEQGEVQYMLRITHPCGLSVRFDHLLTLSPAMQAEADKLPVAKPDDSRTTNFEKPITLKKGDTIATAVGFKNTHNVSFDLGVYDLRQRNGASKDQSYVARHQNELSQAAYAVCWFDLLSANDARLIKSLPPGDQSAGSTSDYCK